MSPVFNDPRLVPQSWYVIARSGEVPRGRAITRELADRRIAVYRGESGRVHALDARCAHLGADLGQGRVVGERLRCAFHHWTYAPDGRCVEIRTQVRIPEGARTFAYPTRERYGAIWIFNGPEPLFPIPGFEGWRDDELRVVRFPPQELAAHPHVVASNGLDVHHFRTLHRCAFLDDPVTDEPDRFRVRTRMRLRLLGTAPHERLLRAVAGSEVAATFTTWGGNLATVAGSTGTTPLFVLFSMRPLPGGRSASQTFVFVPRARGWRRVLGVEVLGLLRSVLCMAYILAGDRHILNRIQFWPHLVETDAPLAAFIRQVNRMETFPPGAPPDRIGTADADGSVALSPRSGGLRGEREVEP